MIQASAVFAAAKALWDATAAITAVVPGGLWEGRPKQDDGSPYAVAKVTEQDPEWPSGKQYLAHFTLELTVWSVGGATDAGAIQAAIEATFNRERRTDFAVSGATTVDIRQVPGTVDTDPATLDAKDVKVTASRWEITLLGSR